MFPLGRAPRPRHVLPTEEKPPRRAPRFSTCHVTHVSVDGPQARVPPASMTEGGLSRIPLGT